MQERWKVIKNFEGYYEVSSEGRVKSLKRTIKCGLATKVLEERILKEYYGPRYHSRVDLYIKGKRKKAQVHRLVAEAFIPNPLQLKCVLHKKPVTAEESDNSVTNLKWGTDAQNSRDMVRQNRQSKGSHRPTSKLTEEEVSSIRALHKKGNVTQLELANEYGVGQGLISRIINNKRWKI